MNTWSPDPMFGGIDLPSYWKSKIIKKEKYINIKNENQHLLTVYCEPMDDNKVVKV